MLSALGHITGSISSFVIVLMQMPPVDQLKSTHFNSTGLLIGGGGAHDAKLGFTRLSSRRDLLDFGDKMLERIFFIIMYVWLG